MNYNLSAEDKKKVKNLFNSWMEVQDEKKALAEAEKETKETAKDILDCKLGQVGKLFKLMQKYYNGAAEEEEDVWSVMESIRSSDAEEDSEEEEDS